jgi:adenosylmethionine-8-amino-7-oxononanoate aminotransferase
MPRPWNWPSAWWPWPRGSPVRSGLERVFLADSGSVAVEVALKLAVQFQTATAATLGGSGSSASAAATTATPSRPWVSAILWTACIRPSPDCSPATSLRPVRRRRRRQPRKPSRPGHRTWTELAARHSAELAAIIVEPVLQGAGGMHAYPAECLTALREVADRHGLLLIFDEIATGFGRTGELFAADHAGIVPDIMCVGKALTGGYLTLAAMLCTAEVAAAVSGGQAGALLHGPTFMGNPLACAVANASLGIIETGRWRADVGRIGTEPGVRAGPRPGTQKPSAMSAPSAPSGSLSCMTPSTLPRLPRRPSATASGSARSGTSSTPCPRTSAPQRTSPRSRLE